MPISSQKYCYIIFFNFTAPVFDNFTREMKLNFTNPLVRLGYNLVDGFGYYKVHIEYKNWASAVRICEEEGAHLLILDSDEEAYKVGELINGHQLRNFDVWVGVHYVQGKWMTVFSEYCILRINKFITWNHESMFLILRLISW